MWDIVWVSPQGHRSVSVSLLKTYYTLISFTASTVDIIQTRHVFDVRHTRRTAVHHSSFRQKSATQVSLDKTKFN